MPPTTPPDLIRHAVQLLERIYRPGYHYKKCGLMLMDLQPATLQRFDLFDARDTQKQRSLMKAMDALNDQYGARTVKFVGMGTAPQWTMKAEKRSQCYTTDWRELPIARAGE